MDFDDYVARLETEGPLLATAAQRAGLLTAVPTCPGWTVRDLVLHVGAAHRLALGALAGTVGAIGAGGPVGLDGPDETVPDDPPLGWLLEGHAALVAALRAATPDIEAMTFWPVSSARTFWGRRQAHETAIHRADVEIAVGHAADFPAAFAADGIEELLGGLLSMRSKGVSTERAVTLDLVAQEGPRWQVTVSPERIAVLSGGAGLPVDVTVEGSAAALYLWLWNRGDGAVRITGDQAAAELWHRVRVRSG
jgi:uncharacterized protein (TIGR03083 family)